MRTIPRLGATLLAVALALAAGCSTDKPSTPTAPPAQPVTPGPAATGASLSISVSPGELEAGSVDPATVTVTGTRNDTGGALPDRTVVTVSTTLGDFGSLGSGSRTQELELLSGRVQLVLFPGSTIGTASLKAEKLATTGYSAAIATATLRVVEKSPFFIESVSPNTGSPNGGETVQIFGGGFESPLQVFFGGVPAVIQSSSGSRITVTSPRLPGGLTAGQTQTVAVSVNNAVNTPRAASASLSNAYTYAFSGGVLQPTVLSVTPASGPNEGGTEVVITGDGFESPLKVDFGAGPVTSTWVGVEAVVTSVSRTRIVVRSPAATGFGQANRDQLVSIRVTNLNTGRSGSMEGAFKYGVSVLITSVGPTQGPYTGGTLVTINGQGFDEPVAVELAGIGQQVISVSGSQIVARTVPVRVEACAPVGISNGKNTKVVNIETGAFAADGPGFTYLVPKPSVFGASPSSGPQTGGTLVSINGSNFRSPAAVEFIKGGAGGDVFAASVQGLSSCSSDGWCAVISALSPSIPNSALNLETGGCDDNNDGTRGQRYIATPFSLRVRNLETGCSSDALSNAFTYQPSDTSCRGDVAPAPTPTPVPLQCVDGFDNDSDGFIDAADPQCTGPLDNDESA